MKYQELKFYLSSYKIGNQVERLKMLVPEENKKIAYISNALDFSTDLERRKRTEQSDIDDLTNLGLKVEHLDLRNYFGQSNKLKMKISEFGAFWVSGGSVFVLRQEMNLSGFDDVICGLSNSATEILYGGYSAGICVLSPTLRGMELYELESTILSKHSSFNRQYGVDTIWEGLGLISYCIVPHYKSDHPESKDADRVVQYLTEQKIPHKTLIDGEVIIESSIT